jgi:hypothetical protein
MALQYLEQIFDGFKTILKRKFDQMVVNFNEDQHTVNQQLEGFQTRAESVSDGIEKLSKTAKKAEHRFASIRFAFFLALGAWLFHHRKTTVVIEETISIYRTTTETLPLYTTVFGPTITAKHYPVCGWEEQLTQVEAPTGVIAYVTSTLTETLTLSAHEATPLATKTTLKMTLTETKTVTAVPLTIPPSKKKTFADVRSKPWTVQARFLLADILDAIANIID